MATAGVTAMNATDLDAAVNRVRETSVRTGSFAWRFVRIALLVCMIAAMLPLAFMPAVAQAKDISSAATVTVDDYDVTDWVTVNITVDFVEDEAGGLNFDPGDTITLSWPEISTNSEGYYASLIVNTVTMDIPMVSDPSVSIGTAVLTSTGITITLSDAVENLQQVSGTVTFSAVAHVTGDVEVDDSRTVDITSGTEVKASITVTQDENATPVTGFGYKQGSVRQATDGSIYFQWGLILNRGLVAPEAGTTITVTDTLPDGLQFAAVDGNSSAINDASYYDADGLVGSASNILQYISISEDGTTLTANIPAEAFYYNGSVMAIRIGVTAVISDTSLVPGDGNTRVRNTVVYSTNGTTLPGSDSQSETHTASVIVPQYDASGNGIPKGTIEVSKVVKDTDGSSVPVQGVTFRVYRLDADGNHVSGWTSSGADYLEVTTGEDGLATVTNLDNGDYAIAEYSAPIWVVKTTQEVKVTLAGTEGASKEIVNDIVTTSLTATKVWKNADGTDDESTHPTIWFELFRSVNGGEAQAVEGSIVELADGQTQVTWNNMPQYDAYGNEYVYTVHEVDADGNDYVPEGYDKSEDGMTVTNTAQTPAVETTSVSVEKVWNGTAASSATVHLLENGVDSGQSLTLTEDNNWSGTFDDLPVSDSDGNEIVYTVSEDEIDLDGDGIADYSTEITGSAEEGFVVTNTPVGPLKPQEPATPDQPDESETSDQPTTPTTPGDSTTTTTTTTSSHGIPQTGDSTWTAGYAVLAFAGACAVVAAIVLVRRARRSEHNK